MSPPDRPKGDGRSAQPGGAPANAPGRCLALVPQRAARRVVR